MHHTLAKTQESSRNAQTSPPKPNPDPSPGSPKRYPLDRCAFERLYTLASNNIPNKIVRMLWFDHRWCSKHFAGLPFSTAKQLQASVLPYNSSLYRAIRTLVIFDLPREQQEIWTPPRCFPNSALKPPVNHFEKLDGHFIDFLGSKWPGGNAVWGTVSCRVHP